MEEEKKLFWLLLCEGKGTPLIRKHVRAKTLGDALLFISNTFRESIVVRYGELEDVVDTSVSS